jgi:hypothetical protein
MRTLRALALLAFVAIAAGCSRSGLYDGLGTAGLGDDGGEPFDSSTFPPTDDDVTVSPTDDVTVPPAEDVTVFPPPPPVFDGAVPPLDDVPVPPTEDVSVPPGGCSYATCSGCCDGNGGCHSGHDTSACGGQGEGCRTCDQLCVDGICLNLSSNCGPSTCPGCCLGTDVCTDGLHAGACGSGGMQCESCNPATGGGTCVASASGAGGACVTPVNAACDASSCPTGCCVGDLCVQGTQDIACGSGGIGCQDCTQNGRTCIGRTCSF